MYIIYTTHKRDEERKRVPLKDCWNKTKKWTKMVRKKTKYSKKNWYVSEPNKNGKKSLESTKHTESLVRVENILYTTHTKRDVERMRVPLNIH
jgi:hypothetical protein